MFVIIRASFPVFEIYEDINAGSTAHTPQQLRRAAFWGDYIKVLTRVANSDAGEKFRGILWPDLTVPAALKKMQVKPEGNLKSFQ